MATPEDLEAEAAAPPAAAQEPSLETASTTTNTSDENGQNQSVQGEAREEPSKALEPTTRFSGRQIFYVFGLDGFGAMALSGGVNFAIAYGKRCVRSLTRCFPICTHMNCSLMTVSQPCIPRKTQSSGLFAYGSSPTRWPAMLLSRYLCNASSPGSSS